MIIIKVKMSEDLNLPASLQRLEITPERSDCSKFKANNPFSVLRQGETQPECFLESLSLKAVCSKGNCHCNKKENREDSKALRRTRRVTWRLTPMVVRQMRKRELLLRAPRLKLDSSDQLSTGDLPGTSDTSANSTKAEVVPDDSTTRLQGSPRFLLRAPVLRVTPPCPTSPPTNIKWEQQDCGQQQGSQQGRPAAAMCAVQARNPTPDDTSIEELASYFDLFVHIPKKMSVMAEMMYI